MPLASKAMRQSARHADCTLRLHGCHEHGTVVLAHLRMLGGGGMGMKPSDMHAVYACHSCHSVLDGARSAWPEGMGWIVAMAIVETHEAMRAQGVI